MEMELAVEPQSLKKLTYKSLKRALDLFSPIYSHLPPPHPQSKKIRTSHKLNLEYGAVKAATAQTSSNAKGAWQNEAHQSSAPSNALALPGPANSGDSQKGTAQNDLVVGPALPLRNPKDAGLSGRSDAIVPSHGLSERNLTTAAIMERIPSRWPRPVWHAPWKNYRVISGHLGWVRSVAVDPSNSWFCTGSADRTIKLTLTGHIEQVRGLAVSPRHTYMFSAGDDKQVKCWDLEQNKVIRSYHGHLSGVYCLATHPELDVLLTGGRDSVCRVWDIRSKMQVHALSGHDNTVCSVFTRPLDPQVITGSHDSTIKFWDLRYGKTMSTSPPQKPSSSYICAWDNGSLWFWDWRSGHNFQQSQTIVQPGSLESEAGLYATTYDVTGSRLITCEADKTIKMWKEDENATPETHPLNFKPPKDIRRF
ncbi:hypothetical protein Leryth_019251 [Lithospermum erythrorhizon]|nr:hypothetical protein Leryth_019251 [Lithospermum erythrorhizon]